MQDIVARFSTEFYRLRRQQWLLARRQFHSGEQYDAALALAGSFECAAAKLRRLVLQYWPDQASDLDRELRRIDREQ
jgi:hypothetical protein